MLGYFMLLSRWILWCDIRTELTLLKIRIDELEEEKTGLYTVMTIQQDLIETLLDKHNL